MKTLFLRGILLIVTLLKKLQGIFVNFHEWIFKRKELQKFKTQANLLEGEVEILDQSRQELTQKVFLLINGQAVNLTQPEREMIKKAIEYKDFKEWIETPVTLAHYRMTWRSLKEKITISIIEEVDLAEKEDDETKAGDNEG